MQSPRCEAHASGSLKRVACTVASVWALGDDRERAARAPDAASHASSVGRSPAHAADPRPEREASAARATQQEAAPSSGGAEEGTTMIRTPRGLGPRIPSAANTFNEDEIDALNKMVTVLLRGGDVKLIVRSPPMRKLMTKFVRMKASIVAAAHLATRTKEAVASGAKCICPTFETSFDMNPCGHNTGCPCWGTTLANDCLERDAFEKEEDARVAVYGPPRRVYGEST
jgi:hypothetical protein